jgi:hypothetical protein
VSNGEKGEESPFSQVFPTLLIILRRFSRFSIELTGWPWEVRSSPNFPENNPEAEFSAAWAKFRRWEGRILRKSVGIWPSDTPLLKGEEIVGCDVGTLGELNALPIPGRVLTCGFPVSVVERGPSSDTVRVDDESLKREFEGA